MSMLYRAALPSPQGVTPPCVQICTGKCAQLTSDPHTVSLSQSSSFPKLLRVSRPKRCLPGS